MKSAGYRETGRAAARTSFEDTARVLSPRHPPPPPADHYGWDDQGSAQGDTRWDDRYQAEQFAPPPTASGQRRRDAPLTDAPWADGTGHNYTFDDRQYGERQAMRYSEIGPGDRYSGRTVSFAPAPVTDAPWATGTVHGRGSSPAPSDRPLSTTPWDRDPAITSPGGTPLSSAPWADSQKREAARTASRAGDAKKQKNTSEWVSTASAYGTGGQGEAEHGDGGRRSWRGRGPAAARVRLGPEERTGSTHYKDVFKEFSVEEIQTSHFPPADRKRVRTGWELPMDYATTYQNTFTPKDDDGKPFVPASHTRNDPEVGYGLSTVELAAMSQRTGHAVPRKLPVRQETNERGEYVTTSGSTFNTDALEEKPRPVFNRAVRNYPHKARKGPLFI